MIPKIIDIVEINSHLFASLDDLGSLRFSPEEEGAGLCGAMETHRLTKMLTRQSKRLATLMHCVPLSQHIHVWKPEITRKVLYASLRVEWNQVCTHPGRLCPFLMSPRGSIRGGLSTDAGTYLWIPDDLRYLFEREKLVYLALEATQQHQKASYETDILDLWSALECLKKDEDLMDQIYAETCSVAFWAAKAGTYALPSQDDPFDCRPPQPMNPVGGE